MPLHETHAKIQVVHTFFGTKKPSLWAAATHVNHLSEDASSVNQAVLSSSLLDISSKWIRSSM